MSIRILKEPFSGSHVPQRAVAVKIPRDGFITICRRCMAALIRSE